MCQIIVFLEMLLILLASNIKSKNINKNSGNHKSLFFAVLWTSILVLSEVPSIQQFYKNLTVIMQQQQYKKKLIQTCISQ